MFDVNKKSETKQLYCFDLLKNDKPTMHSYRV